MWAQFVSQSFYDFSEFSESIRSWEVDFRQLTPGQSRSELQQFGGQSFLVTRFYLEQGFDQRGSAPKGSITLGVVDKVSDGLSTPVGKLSSNGLLFFPADKEFQLASQPGFRGCTLSVARAHIEQVGELYGIDALHILSGEYQQIFRGNEELLNGIRHALKHLSDMMELGIYHQYPEEAFRQLEFEITSQLLEVIGGSHIENKRFLTERKQKVIRRSLEYIDAHPASPITIRELTKAVGASIRTLEYAFRDYFGIAPKTYLKYIKLVGVRNDLQRANQPAIINRIAGDWGFSHMGRFASDYKKLFGELPSETLKQ